MDYRFVIKVVFTAFVIVAISEISKRSSMFAALLASLPLTSLLAFIWLYIGERQTEPVARLSMSIFWMVLPSLAFFPILTLLLRQNVSFWLSMGIAVAATAILYYLFIGLLKNFGISI